MVLINRFYAFLHTYRHNNYSLRDTDKPARTDNGTYGGYLYGTRAINLINAHSKQHPNNPMFMYLATQNNHRYIYI